MKHRDIFCASQASTAICLSMEQASCSSSNTIQLGGRVIDRHNPIISDSRRSTSKTLIAPCSSSSQPPIDPKPYHDHKKAKKKVSSSKQNSQNIKKETKGYDTQKKKSGEEKVTKHVSNNYSSKPIVRRNWLKAPAESITPPGSTRSLLSDTAFLDASSDFDPVLALTVVDNKKAQVVCQDKINTESKPSSSSSKSTSDQQVVVLRVSLHCKGCEGKVRKHLSRMQGVSSFNIDYAAKKVTVVGDVTPLSVLASISKVKSAQFWPASASTVGSSGIIETRETKFI